MKKIIIIIILFAVAIGAACQMKQPRIASAKTVKAETVIVTDSEEPKSHICGAPNKTGGNCKKPVKGEGYCHLHKNQKGEQK